MIIFEREKIIYLRVAFFILLNIVFFSNCFLIFYNKWFWAGSYYTHGPIVVVAFIWLLSRRFSDYNHPPENYSFSFSGIIIIIISVFIYLFGLWKNITSFITWGFFLFVFGNSILFFSKDFVFKNIGIFIYLLLAVPIPEVIINRFTFELNLFASYTSEIFISLIYPSTLRSGNILHVNGYNISITYECSGLSNLLSMFSVVWLMALFQSNKTLAMIDYLISIPAAIISNILRIFIITILVVNGYEQIALYDWHSEIGIIVFIIIVITIALFNELPIKKSDNNKITSEKMLSFFYKKRKLINTYTIFLIILLFISFFLVTKSNFDDSSNEILLKDKIPVSSGVWQSRDEKVGDYYFNSLGTNDLLMRTYWKKDNHSENDNVYLYIIRSKDNVSAFHRPELCLRGEGYELLSHDETDLHLNNKKTIPVQRMLFVDNYRGLLVYYWYYINKKNINDVIKYQLVFLLNMNNNTCGNFIRISKPVNLNKVSQEEKKMKQFANEVIPGILEYL